MLNSLFKYLLIAAFAIVGLIGLFIAWWVALFAVLGVTAWFALRRLFPGLGRRAMPEGDERRAASPVIIEGQFEVEPEEIPHRPSLEETKKPFE